MIYLQVFNSFDINTYFRRQLKEQGALENDDKYQLSFIRQADL